MKFVPQPTVKLEVLIHCVDYLCPHTKRGLTETLQMRDELQAIFNRKVDFIEKAAIERSENWLGRKNILESAEVIYAS